MMANVMFLLSQARRVIYLFEAERTMYGKSELISLYWLGRDNKEKRK